MNGSAQMIDIHHLGSLSQVHPIIGYILRECAQKHGQPSNDPCVKLCLAILQWGNIAHAKGWLD